MFKTVLLLIHDVYGCDTLIRLQNKYLSCKRIQGHVRSVANRLRHRREGPVIRYSSARNVGRPLIAAPTANIVENPGRALLYSPRKKMGSSLGKCSVIRAATRSSRTCCQISSLFRQNNKPFIQTRHIMQHA